MFFKSFFDEELAQMSYMTGCQRTGEAMVIDPARDINPYLETADKEGFTITKVTETHIHADFLSGARELAQHTGATLYLSNEGDNDWKYQYLDEVDHVLLNGGDQFHVGNIKFDVLHTPGIPRKVYPSCLQMKEGAPRFLWGSLQETSYL